MTNEELAKAVHNAAAELNKAVDAASEAGLTVNLDCQQVYRIGGRSFLVTVGIFQPIGDGNV